MQTLSVNARIARIPTDPSPGVDVMPSVEVASISHIFAVTSSISPGISSTYSYILCTSCRRSAVCRQACLTVCQLVSLLPKPMEPLACYLLPDLIKLTVLSIQVRFDSNWLSTLPGRLDNKLFQAADLCRLPSFWHSCRIGDIILLQ